MNASSFRLLKLLIYQDGEVPADVIEIEKQNDVSKSPECSKDNEECSRIEVVEEKSESKIKCEHSLTVI